MSLKRLYFRLFISSSILLSILLGYGFVLNYFKNKINSLYLEYEKNLKILVESEQQTTKKRVFEEAERSLITKFGLSLNEMIEALKSNLPYLEKNYLKQVFQESKYNNFKFIQTEVNPQIKVTIDKSESANFLKFLKHKLIYPEITKLSFKPEGDQVIIQLEFEH